MKNFRKKLLQKVWIGTHKEFQEHRFRIVDEYEVVVIDGYAIGRTEDGRGYQIGTGVLIIWDEVEL